MKYFKWTTISLIVILFFIVVIQTFTQDIFTHKIPLLLFVYRTPEFPIFYYVAGAFLFGLVVGLTVALVNYFSFSSHKRKLTKRVKELEKDLEEVPLPQREHKTEILKPKKKKKQKPVEKPPLDPEGTTYKLKELWEGNEHGEEASDGDKWIN